MKTKKTDLGALDSEAFIRNVLEKNFKQKKFNQEALKAAAERLSEAMPKPDIKTKAA
tara:strand:- start:794 stop:964 length:171 start_codon:yes stop_codon:yes gene_type:complete